MKLRKWTLTALAVCMGVIGGIFVSNVIIGSLKVRQSTAADSGAMNAAMPMASNMEEWVDGSENIIDGQVIGTEFVGYTTTGYGTGGTLNIVATTHAQFSALYLNSTNPPAGPPPLPPIPVTDQTIMITHVYKGQLNQGQTVILRMFDHYANEQTCYLYPIGVSGDVFLMGLNATPDGMAYGLPFQAQSRLDMTPAEVQETWCSPSTVIFTENVTPQAFLDEMQLYVSN